MLASCSNEEELKVNSVDSQIPVGFSTYASRAGDFTNANFNSFGVFGYWNNGTAWASTADASKLPDFMYNQEVTKSGSDWTYTPLKYWPADPADKVSFYAYAPYQAAGVTSDGTNSAITGFTAKDYAGVPKLDFTVGTRIANQKDFGYAYAIDQTNTPGTVDLQFKHALSRVSFKVKGWESTETTGFDDKTTVTVHQVSLVPAYKGGKLDITTGNWTDIVAAGNQAYVTGTRYSNIQNNVIQSTVGNWNQAMRLNADDDYIYMMPDLNYVHSSGADAYAIIVDYTVVTNDSKIDGNTVTIRNKVYRWIKPSFLAGKSYVITVHLGMDTPYSPDAAEDGPVPTDPDSDPANDVNPTPAGHNSYVQFTATMADWDGENAVEIGLSK